MPAADIIPVGWAVRLVSLKSFADELDSTPAWTARFLDALKVPLVEILDKAGKPQLYFNLPTLEAALYALTQPFAPGFKLPTREGGSYAAYLIQAVGPTLKADLEATARVYGTMTRQAALERCQAAALALRASKGRIDRSRIRRRDGRAATSYRPQPPSRASTPGPQHPPQS